MRIGTIDNNDFTKIAFALASAILFCFVLSTLNTHFSTSNRNLSSDIERFTDDKINLRASYLSKISAQNLTTRAGKMKMVQAQNTETKIIDVDKPGFFEALNLKSKKLASNFVEDLKSPRLIVSGY